MKRTTLTIFLALALLTGICVSAVASSAIREIQATLSPDVTVEYDGIVQVMKDVNGNEVFPIMYEGTTYLPIRAVSGMLGLPIEWVDSTRTVEIDATPSTGVATTTCFATVEAGRMIGYNYNGTYTFLGVPYGQAGRFERATKIAPWSDLYLALAWGESSYQNQATFNPRDLGCAVGPDMVFSEDCLYLNVWSQSMNETAKKPVVVFIHGGGMTTGGSSELDCYDLTNLSSSEDLVCVSLNHRLDVFGYMDLSAYGEQYAESGNNSISDIILALEWVRNNIEKFGGDPNNVTLLGQSGGTAKVSAVMGMTDAQGLYHKVDLHSGIQSNTNSARTIETARQNTQAIVDYLGITGTNEEIVAQLKDVDPLTLLAAGTATRFSSNPVVGTALYPQLTYNNGVVSPVFLDNGASIMHSTVLGEMNSNFGLLSYRAASEDFTDFYIPGMNEAYVRDRIGRQWGEDNVEAVIAAWDKAYPGKPMGHMFFTASRNNVFATMMAEAGVTIYQSVYAYDYPILGGVTAVHSGGDLPLIFKNLTFRDARLFAGDEVNARRVSDAVTGALRAFAYTGNPSTGTLVFEPFTVETGANMIWDVNPTIRYYHDTDLMALIYG